MITLRSDIYSSSSILTRILIQIYSISMGLFLNFFSQNFCLITVIYNISKKSIVIQKKFLDYFVLTKV